MSRIGKKPIPVPHGVSVAVEGNTVRVEGPKGKLSQLVPDRRGGGRNPDRPDVSVTLEPSVVRVGRSSDDPSVRALHGLTRSLLANMVHGVVDGFERKLEIVGIGYRAQLQGKNLQLALGYSHPVIFPLPDGVQAEVDRQVSITLKGADKALLGQVAAKLRALRKPDPYKGKGIKYAEEHIRRKVGKKAGAK